MDRGHTIEAWCPSTADQTYLPLGAIITEHVLPFDWKSVPADRRLLRYRQIYRNIVSKIKAMDRHCRQCAEEINRGGFDLLFASSCRFFRAASIGRYVKIPKVLYLHEPNRRLYEAMPQLPWLALPPRAGSGSRLAALQNFAYNLIQVQAFRVEAREEWLNAKAFDSILANSYFSRESILRAYGLNAQVCYLGVDSAKFANRHRPRENFLVGLGAVVFEKNIPFAIDAVAGLPQPRPPLVWIGNMADPGLLESLKQQAGSLGVCFEPHIRVSDDELVDLLNRAALLVYAPRLEPFGYAPLEANACGLPVVAVAEGGVRETVVDGVNGLLADPDTRAVAAAMERLLKDSELAGRLGENGCKQVQERWSLTASMDRLERVFSQLLDTTSPSMK